MTAGHPIYGHVPLGSCTTQKRVLHGSSRLSCRGGRRARLAGGRERISVVVRLQLARCAPATKHAAEGSSSSVHTHMLSLQRHRRAAFVTCQALEIMLHRMPSTKPSAPAARSSIGCMQPML